MELLEEIGNPFPSLAHMAQHTLYMTQHTVHMAKCTVHMAQYTVHTFKLHLWHID